MVMAFLFHKQLSHTKPVSTFFRPLYVDRRLWGNATCIEQQKKCQKHIRKIAAETYFSLTVGKDDLIGPGRLAREGFLSYKSPQENRYNFVLIEYIFNKIVFYEKFPAVWFSTYSICYNYKFYNSITTALQQH
jgi:hypothetical protein